MGLVMFQDMKKESEFIARLLSVVFERFWLFEDVPDDQKMANQSTFIKAKKDSENYRPVSPPLALKKVMEQILLICHLQGHKNHCDW